jgi:hypothetical protein
MAGLDPAIPLEKSLAKKMNGRIKPGQDAEIVGHPPGLG